MTEQAVTEQAVTTTVAYDITANRKWLLQFMQQTHNTLRHVFAAIDQERAFFLTTNS